MTFKQRLLLIIGIFLLILGWAAYTIYKERTSPQYEQVYKNPDTGQTIINTPNQTPETGGTKNYVIVLGANKFIPSGMTTSQLFLTNSLITNYVNKNLGHRYSQVAVLNSGYHSTGNKITAKMRLGNSGILINITILYQQLVQVRVEMSYNNNPFYSYDSGWQTAKQTSSINNNSQPTD